MSGTRPIPLNVASLTDIGKKRQRNEDSFNWEVPEPGSPKAVYGAALLVCDGMGGVGQGDVASKAAVDKFFSTYYDLTDTEMDTEKRVHKALEAAHQSVRDAAAELGRLYIGTTAAGLVIREDGSAVCFNLGDSRVYLLRGSEFKFISKDQSVNAAQLERHEITPEQALNARNNNITMFLGHPLEMTPHYTHLTVRPDDIFMVCSDGLWDVVREKQLQQILETQPPEQAVRTYIEQTLRGGAPDNVTVIVASTRKYKSRRKLWPWLLLPLVLIGIGVAVFLFLQARNNTDCCDDVQTTGAVDQSATDTGSEIQIIATTGETATVPPAPMSDNETYNDSSAIQVLPSRTPSYTPPPTETPPPTLTYTPSSTYTAMPTETETSLPTQTSTRRPTRTPLPTETPQPSVTPSVTPTATATRTPSATRTATSTATDTPTNTFTPTATATATDTATATATSTPTATATATATNTATATFTPTITLTASVTSTSNPQFWALRGTPRDALELVTVARLGALAQPPETIYVGNIERRYPNITMTNPLDAGNRFVLVYLAPDILGGSRLRWLIEDVQPQFEVLAERGIRVYSAADFNAPERPPIQRGALVIVTGITADSKWFKIRARGNDGWVSSIIVDEEVVRFIGDINEVPIVSPQFVPTLALTVSEEETPLATLDPSEPVETDEPADTPEATETTPSE